MWPTDIYSALQREQRMYVTESLIVVVGLSLGCLFGFLRRKWNKVGRGYIIEGLNKVGGYSGRRLSRRCHHGVAIKTLSLEGQGEGY